VETSLSPTVSGHVCIAGRTRSGERKTLFLEADLATQGKAAFGDKLTGYALGLASGALTKPLSGGPLRLGIVTTSGNRLALLSGLVRAGPLPETTRVGLTTFERFLAEGPLAPIWNVPALGTERSQSHVLLDL
jgi:hypothetical protein